MVDFGSQAKESRESHVWWRRRRVKRVMKNESENVRAILVEKVQMNNVTDLRSGGMEGTLFI